MRTTIQLDEALAARLRSIVPPRKMNRFINEAVAEKIGALERAQLEEAMREGYMAWSPEQAEAAEDWKVVEVEAWPE